jgi:hypothetical protein
MQLSQQLGNGGEDAMKAAIDKTLRSGAGALAGVGNRSGTFGDTTTAILQNDLAVRSAEAGVLAKQNAQTATGNTLAQLMQSIQAGQESTTGKAATTNTQNTNTSGTTQNTGTNTSNTSTTQDRNAQETAVDRTSTSTTGQSNTVTDNYTDFYKDGSSGFGTNKGNPLAQLGIGVGAGTPGVTTTPTNTSQPGTPLALPSMPAAPGANPAVTPVGTTVAPAAGPANGGNPLEQIAALLPGLMSGAQQTTKPIDPNNPLSDLPVYGGLPMNTRFTI